jgi:hypothetical protein
MVASTAVAFVAPARALAQGVLENPSPGSVKSGIAVLSGWKCSAASPTSITLTIDDLPPIQAAYGTGRGDTVPVCGDANNGFGVLFNFGLLPEGEHEIVARDAGVEFARAIFTTSRLGPSFLTGATAVSFVRDFPEAGQGAFLFWEQASQNFTIGGTCGRDGDIRCPPAMSRTGWGTADQESASGTYAPSNAINSLDLPNTVLRTDVGTYLVTFNGLGSDGNAGIVHVTARQADATFCTIAGWIASLGDRVVDVRCFDETGAAADAQFDVVYTRPSAGSDIRGYLLASDGQEDSPDAPEEDFFVADLAHQLNTAGPLATVSRLATGVYRAVLPGLASGANVGLALSAVSEEPVRCRVLDVGVDADARFGVDVECLGAGGGPVDSAFSLSVLRNAPLASLAAQNSAYLRMRTPETPSIGPDESYNSLGGALDATRTALGRYTLRLGGFAATPGVGTVHVTAIGQTATHCKVEGVGTSGSDMIVAARCFAGAEPADSELALTYVE